MDESNPHDVTQDHRGNPIEKDVGSSSHHPQRIGRYRIEKVLGKGGFGLVYLAQDEQLNRPVAVKVPHARLISKPEDAQAYLAEARTVANLDHPGIVPVLSGEVSQARQIQRELAERTIPPPHVHIICLISMPPWQKMTKPSPPWNRLSSSVSASWRGCPSDAVTSSS